MDFRSAYRHGFLRVAACTLRTALADPATNAETVIAAARVRYLKKESVAMKRLRVERSANCTAPIVNSAIGLPKAYLTRLLTRETSFFTRKGGRRRTRPPTLRERYVRRTLRTDLTRYIELA